MVLLLGNKKEENNVEKKVNLNLKILLLTYQFSFIYFLNRQLKWNIWELGEKKKLDIFGTN